MGWSKVIADLLKNASIISGYFLQLTSSLINKVYTPVTQNMITPTDTGKIERLLISRPNNNEIKETERQLSIINIFYWGSNCGSD